MKQNEIDNILAQYGGYGSTNANLPPETYTTPVLGSNIVTNELPSLNNDFNDQSEIVSKILSEPDNNKFNQIAQYSMQDPDMNVSHKKTIQQEAARRYLISNEQEKLQKHIDSIPSTELSKIFAQDSKTDLENALPGQLTEDQRRNAAWNATVYKKLGLDELAKRYEEQAYPRPSFSSEMLLDGSRYTVQRDPYGRVLNAYDSSGRRISGEEFGSVSAGVLSSTGKNAPETSFTVGYDKLQRPYTKTLIGGQLFFTNKETGERSITAPEGYHEGRNPIDAVAIQGSKEIRSSMIKENIDRASKNLPPLYTDDQINAAAENFRTNMVGTPTITTGGGLSVSNDTPKAVQPLIVPANSSTLVRNNNPAGIKDPSSGKFATYDSPEEGDNAQHKLLSSKGYGTLALSQIPAKWAPIGDGDNNPKAYLKTLKSMLPDINFDDSYNELSPENQTRFRQAQSQIETGIKGGLLFANKNQQVSATSTSSFDSAASAIANYEVEPPKANTVEGRLMLEKAKQINPNFDANQWFTKKKVMGSFVDGKNADALKNIKNVWVDLGHIDTVAKALANGDISLMNKIKNDYKTYAGSELPTNFNSMQIAVAGEVAKVIKNGVATTTEIADIQKTLGRDSSPAQIAGVIKQLKDLASGRAKTLKDTYTANGGNPAKFNELVADNTLLKGIVYKSAEADKKDSLEKINKKLAERGIK